MGWIREWFRARKNAAEMRRLNVELHAENERLRVELKSLMGKMSQVRLLSDLALGPPVSRPAETRTVSDWRDELRMELARQRP